MLFRSSERILKYNKNGLIPAIIQDAENQRVLSLFYLNREAVKKTRKTGDLWLYYRSKKKVWKKGSSSGRSMKVVNIIVHHDRNILLISVIPNGPACHTGNETCFLESLMDDNVDSLQSNNSEKVNETVNENDGFEALKQLFDTKDVSGDSDIVSEPMTEQKSNRNDLLKEIYSSIQQQASLKQDSYLTGEKIAQQVGENAMQLLMNVTQKDYLGIVKKESEMIQKMLMLLVEKQIKIDHLLDELKKTV